MYICPCVFRLLYLVPPEDGSTELKYIGKYILRNNMIYIDY